ncbi:MAG: NAD(P)-dependent oxidoreductase [Burkholderiales bacterium]|nr:NAD(P)-dependent oxidoreductase [Burkholderiales bacterium]
MKIGFVGTGLMGAPMVRRLLAAGHEVVVWNRTAARAEALRSSGAQVAPSLDALARDAEALILCVENAAAVHEVLFERGLLPAMRAGQIVVDMGSIAPHEARELAARLHAHGVQYLDAPVSGGPQGAEEGTLAIMVGGEEKALAPVRDVLACMGNVTRLGPSGAGQTAKLINQTISSTVLLAVAECTVLATRLGIDPGALRSALAGGFADSKVLQLHGKRMAERNFAPGGTVATYLKDLRNAERLIRGAGLALPAAELARRHFAELAASGHGNDDIASVVLVTQRSNGLAP